MSGPRTIPFGKPMLGEAEKRAVLEVMDSGVLAHGPRARAFEEAFAAFTGAPHAVSASSCTAALHLAYRELGVGPGDEVIVPAMTHTATAHAAAFTGARPVFVDAERETGNIDIEQIEPAITERTRAIAVVHYLGLPVDMPRVVAVAQRHGLRVIEDCALALGASRDGVHAGLWGDAGCFSFYPVKHLTTAEGGMLITRDADLAAAVARNRAFGLDRSYAERKTPGMYDVLSLGYNYRMNEIAAAIGVEQLKRMPGFLEARKANFEALTEGLKTIDEVSVFASSHAGVRSSYYCHVALLNDALAPKRPEVMAALQARGVGTSIYYPQAVPNMAYYRRTYGCRDGEFPVACWIAGHSIALPVGPHVGPEDVAYMVEALKGAIREVS